MDLIFFPCLVMALLVIALPHYSLRHQSKMALVLFGLAFVSGLAEFLRWGSFFTLGFGWLSAYCTLRKPMEYRQMDLSKRPLREWATALYCVAMALGLAPRVIEETSSQVAGFTIAAWVVLTLAALLDWSSRVEDQPPA